jgi:hypothetical protein
MKTIKYSLLSALFISSASFATEPQEQVVLPSLLEVASFCSGDKNCNSITPVVDESELKYKVQYENVSQGESTPPTTAEGTDPIGDGI